MKSGNNLWIFTDIWETDRGSNLYIQPSRFFYDFFFCVSTVPQVIVKYLKSCVTHNGSRRVLEYYIKKSVFIFERDMSHVVLVRKQFSK